MSTVINCPNCNSINASCNTDMVLTSEPPKYSCYCKDCHSHWYIYCRDLHKYVPSFAKVTLAEQNTVDQLEKRIKSLEEQVNNLQKVKNG